jgi:hypothetical protein
VFAPVDRNPRPNTQELNYSSIEKNPFQFYVVGGTQWRCLMCDKSSKKNNLKFICFLVIMMIAFGGYLYSEKVATLTGFYNPMSIVVDDQNIYIIEKSTVYIYSAESYKFINKFGREGEGPEEFSGEITIIPQPEHLIINSQGKVSFYSKDGKFIKDIKTPGGQSLFFPLKKGFIGKAREYENDIAYFTVNLYDPELQKGREIYRVEDFQQPGKSTITFPIREPKYTTLNNKIVVAGKPGFVIDILDHTGRPLNSIINKNIKRRKFTKKDEEEFRILLKETYKEKYYRYNQYLHFLDFFPEIAFIFTDSDKIYITTWRILNNEVELFEYDSDGELLNVFFVKLFWRSVLKPYPLRIKNGKIYQLLENREEQWELHVSKLQNE